MTALDLDAIDALAAAATPGPWRVDSDDPHSPSWIEIDCDEAAPRAVAQVFAGEIGKLANAWAGSVGVPAPQHIANAALIAASRTLMPALVLALRTERETTARLRAALELCERALHAADPYAATERVRQVALETTHRTRCDHSNESRHAMSNTHPTDTRLDDAISEAAAYRGEDRAAYTLDAVRVLRDQARELRADIGKAPRGTWRDGRIGAAWDCACDDRPIPWAWQQEECPRCDYRRPLPAATPAPAARADVRVPADHPGACKSCGGTVWGETFPETCIHCGRHPSDSVGPPLRGSPAALAVAPAPVAAVDGDAVAAMVKAMREAASAAVPGFGREWTVAGATLHFEDGSFVNVAFKLLADLFAAACPANVVALCDALDSARSECSRWKDAAKQLEQQRDDAALDRTALARQANALDCANDALCAKLEASERERDEAVATLTRWLNEEEASGYAVPREYAERVAALVAHWRAEAAVDAAQGREPVHAAGAE